MHCSTTSFRRACGGGQRDGKGRGQQQCQGFLRAGMACADLLPPRMQKVRGLRRRNVVQLAAPGSSGPRSTLTCHAQTHTAIFAALDIWYQHWSHGPEAAQRARARWEPHGQLALGCILRPLGGARGSWAACGYMPIRDHERHAGNGRRGDWIGGRTCPDRRTRRQRTCAADYARSAWVELTLPRLELCGVIGEPRA